jgi:hypothetical protein
MKLRLLGSIAVAGAIAGATLMLGTPAYAMPLGDFQTMCQSGGGSLGHVPHYEFDMNGNAQGTGLAWYCNLSSGRIWADD